MIRVKKRIHSPSPLTINILLTEDVVYIGCILLELVMILANVSLNAAWTIAHPVGAVMLRVNASCSHFHISYIVGGAVPPDRYIIGYGKVGVKGFAIPN